MERYLASTPLLNYHHPAVQTLVSSRRWRDLPPYDAIGTIYAFVKDEIAFGYNTSDDISASAVLTDGYGQCNTKGTLFMALLRAVGIPCRFHGFTIFNTLQRGAIPTFLMPLAPEKIIHSWVEVRYQGAWRKLEGFILDEDYLCQLQRAFARPGKAFTGYGVATPNLADPPVSWCGGDTFIQREGIADDLGVYDAPDVFYQEYGANLGGIKGLAYRFALRHLINWNVGRIRRRGVLNSRAGSAKGLPT